MDCDLASIPSVPFTEGVLMPLIWIVFANHLALDGHASTCITQLIETRNYVLMLARNFFSEKTYYTSIDWSDYSCSGPSRKLFRHGWLALVRPISVTRTMPICSTPSFISTQPHNHPDVIHARQIAQPSDMVSSQAMILTNIDGGLFSSLSLNITTTLLCGRDEFKEFYVEYHLVIKENHKLCD